TQRVTQLPVQLAGMFQRIKRALAIAGQVPDDAQLNQRGGLARTVPVGTGGGDGVGMQGECLGPGTIVAQQGGQVGGQGDSALVSTVAGRVAQGGEQVGAFGAQP